MSPPLRLTSLGGLQLVGPTGNVLSGRRVDLALLVVVASKSPKSVRREELQALFWGERTEDKARHSLRQVVSRLRNACGPALEADATALQVRHEEIEFDVVLFANAIREGRHGDAINLWTGEFLAGCEDIGGEEFRIWLEVERERLRLLLARCYERAIAHAEANEQWTAVRDFAASWVERFPREEAAWLRHIQALCREGRVEDGTAACHGFVARLKHDLDDEPSAAWSASINRVLSNAREERALVAWHTEDRSDARVVPIEAEANASANLEHTPVSQPPARRGERGSLFYKLAAAAAVVLAVIVAGVRLASARSGMPPTLAVGDITSELSTDSTRGFSMLLAIDLARIAELDVINESRLSEVAAGHRGATPDVVARAAGAREILDGVLSRRPDNTLRADLRRTDLATGKVRGAYTVEARDLTELADLLTERVARDLGTRAAVRRVEGTTTSILAYRFYEQGLRAYYEGDHMAAERFFTAALAEDSTFAMAAYYASRAASGGAIGKYMEQAVRHASREGDRERLLIMIAWARSMADPRAMAMAETLVTRFPGDADAQILYASELGGHRDPRLALAHLHRVVETDSSLAASAIHCRACDAAEMMVTIYNDLDSTGAADRASQMWLGWQPHSPSAWRARSEVLGIAGKFAAAHAAIDSAIKYAADGSPIWHTVLWFDREDYAAIDNAARESAGSGKPDWRLDALWTRVISSRTQGRAADALEAARQYRLDRDAQFPRDKPDVGGLLLEGTALLDAGQPRAAAALFDSCAAIAQHGLAVPSRRGASRAWFWTHAAGAYAAAGDTAALRQLEDSVRVNGQLGVERHQRLYHYVRGLRLASARRPAEAAAEYEQARSGKQDTHVRIYLELGRSLIAAGRPADAIAPLLAGLRGPVSAAGLYATRTELEEQLALAYELSGRRALALEEYRRVARAWSHADPIFALRRAHADARIAALAPDDHRRSARLAFPDHGR